MISAAPVMIRAVEVKVAGKSYWTLGAPARPRRPLVHLLPVYDEYLVAYRDRDAVPHGSSMVPSQQSGYVQFQHALVIGGQVAGTWRAKAGDKRVDVSVISRRRLTPAERNAMRQTLTRYQRFLGVPVSLAGAGG